MLNMYNQHFLRENICKSCCEPYKGRIVIALFMLDEFILFVKLKIRICESPEKSTS